MLQVVKRESVPEVRMTVEGVLDATTAEEMRGLIDGAVAGGGERFRVDLSALRLLDCAGVGALVCLYKRVRDQGATVVFEGLRDQPRVVLRQLGLDRLFGG